MRNPKAVVDSRQLTRNINQKKKPDALQACRCPIFNKHLEFCESVRYDFFLVGQQ